VADETSSIDALEEKKVTELRIAQGKAEQLFHEVETRGLIHAGITESCLNQEIYDLAKEMFGISTYWHKRIVRAGANTLLPYAENPPDHTIGEDDILFLDLGPVFEEYEADFGRTFVIGSDHPVFSAGDLLDLSSIYGMPGVNIDIAKRVSIDLIPFVSQAR
jgi:Xaa-Pro dipeptidase